MKSNLDTLKFMYVNLYQQMGDLQEHKKALVIGISDYDQLSDLKFCFNDAIEMTNFLGEQGYDIPPHRRAKGRLDWLTLRYKIIDFFQNKEVEPTDLLLFYFSGHGVGTPYTDYYLGASDIDLDIPDYRGFPFYEITNNVRRTKASKIVLMLDCCFSGATEVSEINAAGGHTALSIVGKAGVKEPRKECFAFCSSLDKEKSHGMIKQPYSLFTFFLLQGLRGGFEKSLDPVGNVTPYNLGPYIYDKFDHLPNKLKQKQRPVLKFEVASNIVLAHHKKPKHEVFQAGRQIPQDVLVSQVRPIRGGFSVGTKSGEHSGTLGCLVRDRKNTKRIFILSTHDALCDKDSKVGAKIIQPALHASHDTDSSVIAKLSRVIRPKLGINKATGAIAEVNRDILDRHLYKEDIVSLGEIKGTATVILGDIIKMVGSASSHIEGKVIAVNVTREILFDNEKFKFSELIESDLNTSEGDDGAIVLNNENKAVGMVLARVKDPALTIMCPINRICNLLRVKIMSNNELKEEW